MHISCSSDKASNDTAEMNFSVNQHLLAPTYIDTAVGVQFNPPKNMVSINYKTAQEISDPIRIKQIFSDTLTQATLLYSDLSVLPDSSLQNILNNYQQVLNKNGEWKSIQKAVYQFNGLRVYQFLLQNEQIVGFKLVFPEGTKKKFSLDYAFPVHQYAKYAKPLESSIGSVHPYNQKNK